MTDLWHSEITACYSLLPTPQKSGHALAVLFACKYAFYYDIIVAPSQWLEMLMFVSLLQIVHGTQKIQEPNESKIIYKVLNLLRRDVCD